MVTKKESWRWNGGGSDGAATTPGDCPNMDAVHMQAHASLSLSLSLSLSIYLYVFMYIYIYIYIYICV